MKKSYDNLSMLKIRDITLTTKVCRVKAMVFPVVMYGCESWTIKRLSIEELMLLNCGAGEYFGESLGLQGDQTSQPYRKSTLSIHWKDWCWSWSSSTLATDAKSWLTGKDPDAGKDWRQEEKGSTEDEMVDSISNSMDISLSKLQEMVKEGSLACCNPCGRKESDTTLQLSSKQPNY